MKNQIFANTTAVIIISDSSNYLQPFSANKSPIRSMAHGQPAIETSIVDLAPSMSWRCRTIQPHNPAPNDCFPLIQEGLSRGNVRGTLGLAGWYCSSLKLLKDSIIHNVFHRVRPCYVSRPSTACTDWQSGWDNPKTMQVS